MGNGPLLHVNAAAPVLWTDAIEERRQRPGLGVATFQRELARPALQHGGDEVLAPGRKLVLVDVIVARVPLTR